MEYKTFLTSVVSTLSITCLNSAIAQTEMLNSVADKGDGLETRFETQQGYKYWRPWKEPQDTTTAMNNPDLYAWQLFVALNWPGNPDTCRADPGKRLGDEGVTTWELWREAEETFLPNAEKPKPWKQACRRAAAGEKHFKPSAKLQSITTSGGVGVFFERPDDGPFTTLADEETRLNRSAYEHIRNNKLYSRDEQERLVKAGVRSLAFPLNAKEAKANWVRIEEVDKPRYHWVEVEHAGEIEIWGLAGLHIMTRDMPRWHWSTFEHVDNEFRWPAVYPNAFRGWEIPSSDSVACPEDNLACNKIPAGFGLEGTKWENYRLRGTQIDWVDNRGNPTILPNSKIEGDFDQATMSCITCHALAVKGETNDDHFPIGLNPGTNEMGLPLGYIGAPDPALFRDENGQPIPYLELDFMWSLRHAQREK